VSAVFCRDNGLRVNRTSYKATDFPHPALPGVGAQHPRAQAGMASAVAHESAADRILLTLLALGLMLLAFFVVLTSTATLDQRRIRDVAQSVQARFETAPTDTDKNEPVAPFDADHRAAVGLLRSVVADVFASVISSTPSTSLGGQDVVNPDRVEIDVPASAFFAEGQPVLYPMPLFDKIVALFGAPPSGYRMELVVRSTSSAADMDVSRARIAVLADTLVQRGLAPTVLSVGTLTQASGASAPSLRFTFLLLNADDDLAAVQLMTGQSVGKAGP